MRDSDRADIIGELEAMRDIGMRVTDSAIRHASTDDLSQYEGISVSGLASLFCELYPEEDDDAEDDA